MKNTPEELLPVIEYWEQHGKKTIVAVIVATVAIVGYMAWDRARTETRKEVSDTLVRNFAEEGGAVLQTGDRRVRPRLGLRHGTPLASRGVSGERGHLSSCIWNLGVTSGRCTSESLPPRVDFIHRVEFEEVSGHRVLIKRGPGNRGPTECGTTHEATSGMSS